MCLIWFFSLKLFKTLKLFKPNLSLLRNVMHVYHDMLQSWLRRNPSHSHGLHMFGKGTAVHFVSVSPMCTGKGCPQKMHFFRINCLM